MALGFDSTAWTDFCMSLVCLDAHFYGTGCRGKVVLNIFGKCKKMGTFHINTIYQNRIKTT